MLADCDRCALRDIACTQCMITVLPDGQAGLGDAERRALHALAAAGLIPPLRFRPARSTRSTPPPAQAPAPAQVQAARPGAGPAARRPAARRPTGRPARQPVTSHR